MFEDFSKTFPDYIENHDMIAKLDEDHVKSSEGKEKWREFIERYVLDRKWKHIALLMEGPQL